MNPIAKFFKTMRTRVWFGVAVALVAVMITVAILATGPFYVLICTLFGGEEVVGRDPSIRYYEVEAESKEDAYARGNALNERIAEEGFVLLKNENALPLSQGEKRVSVFGKNSVNLVYGGSGSGAGRTAGAATVYDSLEAAGFTYNPVLKEFYEDNGRSGAGRSANPSIESGVDVLETGETPYSSYDASVTGSYADYNDAAIVVISRIGGEGFDLPRYSATSHYLQLDSNERDLIENVKRAFDKVIVVLNCNNVMEISSLQQDAGISAVIHMAGPGYSGASALGRLLSGEVTPSGHTVDTWAADFTKDPTWNNFGDYAASGGSNNYVEGEDESDYFFVDYEEGIYVGYRYYETRGYTEAQAGNATWYGENVVYPFGYGLSYTEFAWEIEGDAPSIDVTDATKNNAVEINVRVTNTGEYAGKDVVQLYAALPYYDGEIEKPHVVLCGFAKTDTLYPASEANDSDKPNSQVVTLSFDPYSIASYDYNDANRSGESGYELDAGDYSLLLRTDAHSDKAGCGSISFHIEKTVVWAQDPDTGNPVENRFGDADDQLDTVLSRTDWENTWPQTVNGRDFGVTDAFVNESMLSNRTTNNPNEYTEMPATGVETDLKLIDLKGAAYDDPRWQTLLDSLTFQEMSDLYNNGAFRTNAISHIGKPVTIESDGPVGFTNFMSDADVYGTVSYASEVVMGSTWNTVLVEEMGRSVGEEGNFGKQTFRTQTPYSGWYAPGVNIHRSPFGGRNYEYFSEDGFLTGKLAAAEIRGCQSKGVYTFMKHFALNEQETDRDSNGLATWATEQSMRELYFKPFELAVKEGGATGIMSSFNRIGTVWTGGDYRLLTEVLRGEWGFNGTVICDFNVSSYMNAKQMVYAGGDLNLTTTRPWLTSNASDAGDVMRLRTAAHNVLYTVANSCAMNGIDVNTVFTIAAPLWQIVMNIVMIVIGAGLAVWGFFAIFTTYYKKKETGEEKAEKEQ